MNKQDSELFLGCFLIGAAGIIILKLLDVNQFFVTACPIAIMLGYAINYSSKPQDLRGRAGDNLYYLGFLYTLVSLSMSLFEFSLSDESTGKITQIISNFGIAIGSTIFGIFFRVYFNQSDRSEGPEEEVSDFDKTLRERVSTLNSQLGEFSNFRIRLEQILRESSERQKKAVAQFTKTIEESREQFQVNLDSFVHTVSSLNAQVSNLNSAIKDNSEAVAANVEAIKASSEAVSASVEAIKASSEAVAVSVNDLVEKINRLQVPENLLEQLLRPSIQSIETGAAQIGMAGEKLANRLNNVQMPTDQLERRLQQASESVAASVNDLVEKINRLQVPENLLEQLLRSPVQQIGTGGSEKMLTNATDMTAELEHHLQETAAAVSASMSDLVGKTKNIQLPKGFLEQRLRPSIRQIETGAEQIGKAGKEIANKINILQANTDQGRLGKFVGKKIANKINIMQLSEDFLEQLLPSIQQIETGAEQIGKAGKEIANKINQVRVPTAGLDHHLQQTAAEVSASMSALVEKIDKYASG